MAIATSVLQEGAKYYGIDYTKGSVTNTDIRFQQSDYSKAGHHFEVVHGDINFESLEIEGQKQVFLTQADATALKFKEGSFDAVFAGHICIEESTYYPEVF